MQAIILAAGMGKRLGEFTRHNTKCMIKVHSRTLIERMLTQLTRLGMERIIIVVGYMAGNVRSLVGESFNGTPITYVENSIYDKTNNIYSLYLARHFLVEDDTILLESDLIFADRILEDLILNPYPNLTVVAKYENWMDGTVVTLDGENNILSFIPKKAFSYKDRGSYYKTVNIYKFSAAFSARKYVPFIEAYCKALGNNEYYEQVLRVISLLDNPNLRAMPVMNEKWYEIDDIQDLYNAEALFAAEEEAAALYCNRYGGYWRFPLIKDFCYLVNPYFPTAKMKEEMASDFATLLTQYPSGMEVNSRLAARFTNTLPGQIAAGNGAAELISALLRLRNVKTGIVLPTFEEYPNRISAVNRITYTPSNPDFSYTAEDLTAYFGDKPIEQLLVINPDNPSGNMLTKDEIDTLIRWTKERGIGLIVDESFADFASPRARHSYFSPDILSLNPHLIVIKSISKSYGVPGLRLGFLASGDVELIKGIKGEVSIWNINSFAEFFMQIFVKYHEAYEYACSLFTAERERFFRSLLGISFLRVIPSEANYFLCEVTGPYSAKTLCSKLLGRHNILIKDCTNKTKGEYIRIAIRNEEDNDALTSALRRLDSESAQA
ncbi:MAG: aminotransferase class I/II-fold pyridoxal phosphate-dependent enzyme [Tannerellaceae bacterium]|jgi:histidinol-phosphate/aromatic aminotransferase/cobyric acid decarboxylase-like protein/choline kinase|nr:aminotransferase class I/II-fold pyridoxal phosphate-dependent enzyme [Tannerellaceae bacterium]